MTVIIGSFLHERSFNSETYWLSLINEEVELVYFESLSYNMLSKHKRQMYLIAVEKLSCYSQQMWIVIKGDYDHQWDT